MLAVGVVMVMVRVVVFLKEVRVDFELGVEVEGERCGGGVVAVDEEAVASAGEMDAFAVGAGFDENFPAGGAGAAGGCGIDCCLQGGGVAGAVAGDDGVG